MSCRKAFIRDMANVAGLISWPYSRSGATLDGNRSRPFSFLPFVSRSRRWHLMSRPAGAAAGVVDGHPRPGVEDAGHDDGDLARRVELAGALALALGELPQQVFVGAAKDVRLDIVEAEAVVGVLRTSTSSASRPSSTVR